MHEISTVAFVGSGKVASVLSFIFAQNGIEVTGISSRNQSSGLLLANKLGCNFYDLANELQADLIIVAVNDDSVSSVVNKFDHDQRIAYTAGSVHLDTITHPNCSVFYPLQTFTEGRVLNETEIPIFLESRNPTSLLALENLCRKVNLTFDYCNSVERKQYHISAVFLNNFVNHLLYISKDQIESKNLNWNHLLPLLHETFNKSINQDIFSIQTGPARRNDQNVINEHKKMLSGTQLEIYEAVTKSIIETYNK